MFKKPQSQLPKSRHSSFGALWSDRGSRWVMGVLAPLCLPLCVVGTTAANAQTLPISPAQRATATQVAQAGVALSELSPTAPDNYTVKSGDTLWGISGLFLKSPWRWPELWGMNLAEIKNPHLIYPGQQLYLDKSGGRARLRMSQAAAAGDAGIQTVRVSPRTRSQSLADEVIPTLRSQAIEPFLAEPLVVDETGFANAPRIVAAQEGRVLLSKGDRAYVRGPAEQPVGLGNVKRLNDFRVFRNATPLKDPATGEILGYEAQYVGKVEVVKGESRIQTTNKEGKVSVEINPATIDIVISKEEMRVGDRLLPEPERVLTTYMPRAPATPIEARIISVYGSGVANAAQNQVVAISRGSRDGMESGHVLAILKNGEQLIDKTTDAKDPIKLPNERNGLAMVFRTFDRVSYALILDITDGVKVGDRLVNPR